MKMESRTVLRGLGCALSVALLSACATSYVLVGKRHAPTSPDQVRVLLQPPAHFETIAILQTSDMAGKPCFTAQCKTNKVMDRLRDQAAKLGANAILLQGLGSQYAGSVGTSYGSANYGHGYAYGSGFGVSTAIMRETGKAIAIYVDPDPMLTPGYIPPNAIPEGSQH
jgi:hypothetical protein